MNLGRNDEKKGNFWRFWCVFFLHSPPNSSIFDEIHPSALRIHREGGREFKPILHLLPLPLLSSALKTEVLLPDGAIAFLRSISREAIGLGVHLAAGTHDILLRAEYILTSIPSSIPWPIENGITTNVRSNQPNDARHGIQQALESMSDGFGKSASALVQTPLKKYQCGSGFGSALATAVRSTPAAAITPASAAARAAYCALLGFRNSLDPERKRESLEKYSGRTQSGEFKQ